MTCQHLHNAKQRDSSERDEEVVLRLSGKKGYNKRKRVGEKQEPNLIYLECA